MAQSCNRVASSRIRASGDCCNLLRSATHHQLPPAGYGSDSCHVPITLHSSGSLIAASISWIFKTLAIVANLDAFLLYLSNVFTATSDLAELSIWPSGNCVTSSWHSRHVQLDYFGTLSTSPASYSSRRRALGLHVHRMPPGQPSRFARCSPMWEKIGDQFCELAGADPKTAMLQWRRPGLCRGPQVRLWFTPVCPCFLPCFLFLHER